MAAIVETFVGDRRLQLGNEEFVRQMLIGCTWTKIRIGMQVAINGAGTFSNGGLMVGVCQGFTDTYRSPNTTDYIGVQVPQSIGTATYTAGPPPYYTFPASLIALKRTGNSTTLGGNGNVSSALFPAVSSNVHASFCVDVFRAATYTFNVYVNTQATYMGSAYDVTPGQFLNDMQTEGAPMFVSGAPGVGSGNVAYSGPGQHDCLSINWFASSPTIEISNLVVIRFY